MNRTDRHTVALIGNPNTGKSSLFNALTGARQKIANFPGVTVEAKLGVLKLEHTEIDLIDLPGTYSLAARSPDERVAIDGLLGRAKGMAKPDGVLIVVDASSLDRNLYLATQVLEFGLPTVLVLTMVDVATERGISIDMDKLSAALGAKVVAVNSPKGENLDILKQTLHQTLHHPAKPLELPYPEDFRRGVDTLYQQLCDIGIKLGYTPARPESLRLLVDASGPFLEECEEVAGPEFTRQLHEIRDKASGGRSLALIESTARYGQIGQWMLQAKRTQNREGRTLTDKIDAVLTHKLWGTLVFVLVMGLIFQSIYAWAGPLMDIIDSGFGALGDLVGSTLADGMLKSLIVDGIIAGVGGVLIFLPQILILFLFIALLEDIGYMSRAAFLMDRLMARFGLSGRSFIPLLSSFACNIPGVMGARVIEDRNTRLTTIFLAPFMSCSARLPVYTLFIAVFVPAQKVLGFIPLQGLVLFAMYWVGVLFAIPTALVLKRGILKSKVTPFLMEMPSYKMPRARNVLRVLWDRGGSFVKRAGTIILALSIVVWAAAYFPHSDEIEQKYDAQLEALQAKYEPAVVEFEPDFEAEPQNSLEKIAKAHADHEAAIAELEEEHAEDEEALKAAVLEAESALVKALDDLRSADFETASGQYEAWLEYTEAASAIENDRAGDHLENSYLGVMGKAIEPAVRPLGWDWRIGMAAIASFPAREVIVGTLGIIFHLGAEEDEESGTLRETISNDKSFSLATGLSIMVFFALCAQCAATLAVMRRETNSWKWPITSFVYMTSLAYVAALVTYQVAHALGG